MVPLFAKHTDCYNPATLSVKMLRNFIALTLFNSEFQSIMTDFLARPFLTKARRVLSIAFFLLLLSACSVHKIDIQQGNVITQEMFEKLKIGMDKQRVKLTLGTALIVDPFHRDRWDYIYIYKAGNIKEEQSAHLTVYFDNNLLTKIDVQSALPKERDVKKPSSSLRGSSSRGGSSTPQQGGHAH